jgi:hypothetical protein
MVSRAISAFLAVTMLSVAAAGEARTQEARTWLFDDSTDVSALKYGTPETDDLVIAISCEPGAKTMRIVEFVGSSNLTPGSSTRLRLTSGGTSVDYPGQAIANEMDGTVNIEVTTAIDPKLFALLKAGPSLTIAVGGKQLTVPLKAAVPHIAPFEKACLRR